MELVVNGFQNPDSRAWWVAPTYDQTEIGWNTIHSFLPERLIQTDRRSKPRKLVLKTGSTIGFRSANDPASLRGAGLDNLVIDEAAMVEEAVWNDALRPTLTGTGGRMTAISTPNGRDWFYDMFQRGGQAEFPDYESFHYPTADNPHISQSEIDSLRRSHPENSFRREFLAEFIDDTGGVFNQVTERNVESYDYDTVDGVGPYTIGVDFGRVDDYTVIIVLDVNGRLVAFERLRNVEWPTIQDTVERIADRYQGHCNVDATRDNKIVSDLQAAGVTIDPIRFTAQRKRALIENLAVCLEAGEITLPEIKILLKELKGYRVSQTDTGRRQYSAPTGCHDDCVDALALAAHRDLEAENQRRIAETKHKLGGILGVVKS